MFKINNNDTRTTPLANVIEHEEEDYYKPVRVGTFWSKMKFNSDSNIILSDYQLKNIFKKLNHAYKTS